MRSSRAKILLLFAVGAGLVAVALVAQLRQRAPAGVPVVVLARDVQPGDTLDATALRVEPWRAGSFVNVAMVQNRVARDELHKGEPVVEAKLAPPGTRGGLAAVIGEGRRAITVRVNEVVGVAGFALPGSYVDVLVQAQDDASRPISKIVLERILVLAVAQEASRDETRPKVVSAVTLEVTPAQAERLDLARGIGQLSLVLRNHLDSAPAATSGIRKADLLGGAPESVPAPVRVTTPAPAPAPRPRTAAPVAAPAEQVEIIRGVQQSSARF